MHGFIIDLMNTYGYFAIMFLVVLENILPFVPSELVLTFAGFWTTQSSMTVTVVILAATFFSILGSFILYGLGRILSEDRLVRLVNTKVFRMMGFKSSDVAKSKEWFERKGKYSVLFCRCIPILRCLISLPAGMTRMNPFQFALFTGLGSLVWNIFLVNLGAFAGNSWEAIVAKVGMVTTIGGGIILVALAAAFILFVKKRIREGGVEADAE